MNILGQALKIRTGLVVLYSLVIIASSTPAYGDISNVIVVFYFLLIPGYVVTLYLKEDYALLQRLSYSVLFGLALVLTIFAIRNETSNAFPLPFDVVIPASTILLVLLNYYRNRFSIVLS